MSDTLLAVGAAGKFARLVIPALKARGAYVRALVRDADGAATARGIGADEIVMGNLGDASAVAAALKGATRVFYIAPVSMPDETETGKAFVAAAVAAGVRRLVFSSVIHPVLDLPNHANKAPVEAAVLESDLEYSFLHPTVLFQNHAAAWPNIIETGTIGEPWSNDTRFSRVDYRDVAEVAAIALTEDRLLYGTFELCAEGWLDRHDVAALIGEVLAREITARRIDPETLGEDVAPLQPMFEHYDRIGLRGSALTLRAILGREPRTLKSYFSELATQNACR